MSERTMLNKADLIRLIEWFGFLTVAVADDKDLVLVSKLESLLGERKK